MQKTTFIWVAGLLFIFTNSLCAQSFKAGLQALDKQDFGKALNIFEQASLKTPQTPLPYYGLSLLYAQADYAQADARKAYEFSCKACEYEVALVDKKITLSDLKSQQVKTAVVLEQQLLKGKDTIVWLKFLDEYPNFEHKNTLTDALEKERYEALKTVLCIASYRHFLNLYPQSSHREAVEQQIITLAYEQVLAAKDLESCEEFLGTYPDAPQAAAVEALLYQRAFDQAMSQGTMEALEAFVSQYPEASQAAQVRQMKQEREVYSKEYLLGKVDPASHPLFVQINVKYLMYADLQYMHKDAYEAFLQMHEAAKKEGISLLIRSAARTFNVQKYIWENKWKNLGNQMSDEQKARYILTYSSMPGTSRHHWGTDLDLNSLSPDYFSYGQGKKEYDWLLANAGRFGFFQPYTAIGNNRPTGYLEEKWHWSYKPVSEKCLENYKKLVSYEDIKGYVGAGIAEKIRVIKEYVESIEYFPYENSK